MGAVGFTASMPSSRQASLPEVRSRALNCSSLDESNMMMLYTVYYMVYHHFHHIYQSIIYTTCFVSALVNIDSGCSPRAFFDLQSSSRAASQARATTFWPASPRRFSPCSSFSMELCSSLACTRPFRCSSVTSTRAMSGHSSSFQARSHQVQAMLK